MKPSFTNLPVEEGQGEVISLISHNVHLLALMGGSLFDRLKDHHNPPLSTGLESWLIQQQQLDVC